MTALVIGGGIYSLFYYAYIMPLHVDEGGYWFNFTNKAFDNRKIPIQQIPNHTISIYLAKASLAVFGYNGIGLRFPVILFGIFDVGLVFMMAYRFTGSSLIALLSASLLTLTPWFLHYSHELRGYPPYIFFSIMAFIAVHLLVTQGERIRYWILLLAAFMGCYYSTLGSVVFIFCFMATLWILKAGQLLLPRSDQLLPFQSISLKKFLIFSIIATSVFYYILFVQDAVLLLKNRNYQIGNHGESNYWFLKLAIDVFSTFLGHDYLDDPDSVLYQYPLPLYIFSVMCFVCGLAVALRGKQVFAVVFTVLYIITIAFNFAVGHYIQTRAIAYLLPFMVMFYALGLVSLLRWIVSRAFLVSNREGALYYALVGVLAIYMSALTIGKYRNLDVQSGNPYEKALEYLEKNSRPDSLIISSLPGTVGGFYLGEMIRGNADFIYKNARMDVIYYLSPGPANVISLPDYFGQAKPVMNLSDFKLVADFKNMGARKEKVFIYMASLTKKKAFAFDKSFWAENDFKDENHAVCSKKIEAGGVRLACSNYAKKACAGQIMRPPVATGEEAYQLTVFRHVNDYGTKTISLAFFNPSVSPDGVPEKGGYDNIYEVNPMVQVVDDLDYYRQNVVVTDLRLQKMKPGKDYQLCLAGALFNNNSLIENIKMMSFQLQSP